MDRVQIRWHVQQFVQPHISTHPRRPLHVLKNFRCTPMLCACKSYMAVAGSNCPITSPSSNLSSTWKMPTRLY